MSETIEAEIVDPQKQTQALTVRQPEGGALGKPLTLEEVHARLEFVRKVMKEEMKEGQDYGKIPGTGDKPSLLQPGAQKLLMTFNLREQLKREVMREHNVNGIYGHREYELTVNVHFAGDTAENGWDGVGTCSTLEGKYRYRKAERRCPECGKHNIIQGKAEFGGGWICFKKKGGCGAKFPENDERITSQPAGTTEHENPPDYWNTVRKMAFKRALVAAAINATNTSELWTQDVEDMADNKLPEGADAPKPAGKAPTPQAAPKRATAPAQKPAAPPPEKKPSGQAAPKASEQTRAWMIKQLSGSETMATEFFQKLSDPCPLMPNESLSDLQLWAVPLSWDELKTLKTKIADFANGNPAVWPYAPHYERGQKPLQASIKGALDEAKKAIEVPRDPNPDPNSPTAPWRSFPVPWGRHAGVKLADLDKNVLYGFWLNFTPKETWEDDRGNVRDTDPAKLAKDRKFREMLDEAGKHYEFKTPDEKRAPESPADPKAPEGPEEEEEDEIPFL